jgi:hypothetical protein
MFTTNRTSSHIATQHVPRATGRYVKSLLSCKLEIETLLLVLLFLLLVDTIDSLFWLPETSLFGCFAVSFLAASSNKKRY